MSIEQIRARVEAATEGPWRIWKDPNDTENARGSSVETDWAHDGDLDTDLITDWCSPDDAEFISHARQDVPALLAAVDAVLALHKEYVLDGYKQDGCTVCDWEQEGGVGYPCPTLTAITNALEGAK